MDFMELECEKGIMIQFVVIFVDWVVFKFFIELKEDEIVGNIGKEKFVINIIDILGYVDFIIEVERVL